MENITFLRATEAHIPALVEMRIDFLVDHWGNQPEDKVNQLRESLNAYFTEAIPSSMYIAWLAVDGDTYVANGGMLIQHRPGSFRAITGKCAYIMNMYTLPAYRRKGLAANLLNRLMEDGQKAGVDFFELHATDSGEPLYVQQGFTKHKEPTYRKFL